MILMEKKLFEHSTKKNCKKQVKINLDLKKQSREKEINCMLNGKDTIINLITG